MRVQAGFKILRFSLALAGLTLVGCQGERLTPLAKEQFFLKAKPAPFTADFCTMDSEKVKPHLKLLFLVDDSESAKENDKSDLRFAKISTFVNDLASDLGTDDQDESVYFSLAVFGESAEPSDQTSYTDPVDPFGTKVDGVKNRLSYFKNSNDKYLASPRNTGTYSNYIAALDAAKRIIQDDLKVAQQLDDLQWKKPVDQRIEVQPSVYVIFLMSDGLPSLQKDGVFLPEADVRSLVKQALLEKTLGSLTTSDRKNRFVESFIFNTIFYNPTLSCGEDTPAKQFLKQLVEEVNVRYLKPGWIPGKYLCATDDLNFRNFSYPERIMKFDLRNITAENLNLVWYEGALAYDSDADGLSDVEEAILGTQASQGDTDRDGVSDWVEYRVYGCTDSSCMAREMGNYERHLCRGYNDLDEAARGRVVYYHSAGDLLNDCEKVLLGLSPFLFHSGYTWFYDSTLLRAGLNPADDRSLMQSDPELVGSTLYERLRAGLPKFSSEESRSTRPVGYTLSQTSRGSQQNCYHLDVQNFRRWTENDQVRLTIMESTASRRKDVVRSGVKSAGDGAIQFSNGDLKRR